MNKILLYFIVLLFSINAFAEDDSGENESAVEPGYAINVDKNQIYIINEASEHLYFHVRPKNGKWSPYDLKSGYHITISCNKCVANSFEFKMKTDERMVTYNLHEATKYKLDWNEKKKVWDVFKLDE